MRAGADGSDGVLPHEGHVTLTLVSPSEPAAPAAAEPADGYRYWAFLSYSHHDKAVAKRLQKQIETYRVPRRLVGRETPHGVVPARLSPVFRDRDELHAGSDLKASVQDALSKSRWLIVVCTPDAARSPWVNREIIEFKKLHGERRVLALIAHGEPFASDRLGREAEECFPPALRRALDEAGEPTGPALEPIAADMRKHGDGPHRAMLKLVAGMLGVPFDDLVRRDLQRRVRWLTALAVSSAVGVVVFAVLAVMAVQARNEAQFQRQQAEGLIEFMLGDLRKKLEPVGRLEVLDSVGEKALAYYDEQEAGKLDATALGHRSRAMHLIGEIRDLRGQPAEAQKAFERAAQTTAQLLAHSPTDSQRLFDHGQSVFWVGYAAWKQGDGVLAQAKFQEYLELSQRLSAKDPSNLDWRSEVAFAFVNQGMVQLGTGQARTALASLQSAGDLLVQLVPQRPELTFELAHNHGWRAEAHLLLGDYESALKEQRQKLELFQATPHVEKNRAAQRGIVSALNGIGLSELALGRVVSAESTSRASLRLAEVLANEDSQNYRWHVDACAARFQLVQSLLGQGKESEAALEFGKSSDCVQRLGAVSSSGLFHATVIKARAYVLAARITAGVDAQAKLASEMSLFLEQTIPQLKVGVPDRARLAVEIANALIALGELQAVNDADKSRATWRQVAALLEPHADMQNGMVDTPLARARFYLGDIAGAQALATRVQLSQYRHPDYADFVKQLQAVRGGTVIHKTPGVRP